MAISKGHKYLNKFQGWARHDGLVHSEMEPALDEFFVNPALIPEDQRIQAMSLFHDWFLMDRRLTRRNLTPIDLFIESNARKLKKDELAVYKRFSKEKRFGFFRIEDVKPGESLKLKLMPTGPEYLVIDEKGSSRAEPGSYIIASIVPFENHWALFATAGIYPKGNSYPLERAFASTGKDLKEEHLRQRQVLALFMPKVDWHEEGLPRVRARLSMLLQRWGVSDVTIAQVEKDIQDAHAKREYSHPLQHVVLSRAPSLDEANEAAAVLIALWNLTLPEGKSLKGPKEMMLLRDMQSVIGREMVGKDFNDTEEGRSWSREKVEAWLDVPQKELDGKTPREVIRDERRALGNPQEGIGYSFLPSEPIDLDTEGVKLAKNAQKCLIKGDAQAALELYEKAYLLMKGDPGLFRVLGNLAVAHMMLGHREEALELLRGALKANPDYETARNNLHLLESMSQSEFTERHLTGFFNMRSVVKDKAR